VKRVFIYFLLFLTVHSFSKAQNGYWVYFNHKCDTTFNPFEYFHPKAIERRINQNLPLFDESDLPVCDHYIAKVSLYADSVGYASRWLNALYVYGNDEMTPLIQSFSFVSSVNPDMISSENIENALASIKEEEESLLSISSIKKLQQLQLSSLNGQHFMKNSFDGEGITIAVFDAGFPSVNTSQAFKHIRDENRIVATYDFVKKRENVYAYSKHGTNVLSCIAGVYDSLPLGLAPKASFLLARTENAIAEPFSEEQNWLAAVEWADKNGAQIINSSLAYTKNRYFSWEMDGKTSLVAKAANMAARKGILVVNAAGNDGDNKWKFIGTPGDADSVLTVGGIDPETNFHISFSSYGPTKDKRLKPNVCAFGQVVVANNNEVSISSGTSFSAPLVTGFAACLWQKYPQMTNMELMRTIEKSAHLYPYYDYAHGYGMPDANYFFKDEIPQTPTFSMEETNGILTIRIKDGEYEKNSVNDYIYFHGQHKKGYLTKYKVVKVESQTPIKIKLENHPDIAYFKFHYKGYTNSYNLK
jgi:serine protease AprX